MTGPRLSPRSLLFMPGSRPELVTKIGRFAPDAAVVDLEDAVPADGKAAARESTVTALRHHDFGATAVLVRVNPPGSDWFADDLAAVAGLTGVGLVLPKYERRADLDHVRERLGQDVPVVVGLETVRGVADCRQLLAGEPAAVYFGAEDYIADIGGRRTDDSLEVLYARSQVCAGAYLNQVASIDQAVVAVRDAERFRADAARGRDIGYTGKICVHPSQVELAHQAFTPTDEDVRHARAVLRAAEDGVAVVDGQMVDDVHLRLAAAVLARAPGAGQT
jgi:citrate lyase subunit beta/citryl-CoA lyase